MKSITKFCSFVCGLFWWRSWGTGAGGLFDFRDKQLLEKALTHTSYFRQNPQALGDNERLEFLGDAVLSLGVGWILMRHYPHYTEGELSRHRAALVNKKTLARVARDCGVGKRLKFGKGLKARALKSDRVLCGAFEAVVGACFLDRGFVGVQAVVESIFVPLLKTSVLEDFEDYKSQLQELAHRLKLPDLVYKSEAEHGHKAKFRAQVYAGDEQLLGAAVGVSKKQAQNKAALIALGKLRSSTEADNADSSQ